MEKLGEKYREYANKFRPTARLQAGCFPITDAKAGHIGFVSI